MVTNRSFADQAWADLNSPTKEEIDALVLTQNIGPVVAKDLLSPTPMQCAKEDGEALYVVLHIPAFRHAQAAIDSQEVDFIIGANGLTTVRYDAVDALDYFAKQMEVSEIFNKCKNSHLFFGMIGEIYKYLDDELAHMEDRLKEIEKNIFEGREKAMVFAISDASRNILNFRRTIDPHGNMFEFLKEIGKEKFGDKFGAEVKILLEEWRRLMKRAGNQMDLVTELRETNNSMLSTKQNEIMKTLAVIGSVLLPLSVIGQIFGMSIHNFPLIDNPLAFWIILSMMAIVAAVMLVYARLKKWM